MRSSSWTTRRSGSREFIHLDGMTGLLFVLDKIGAWMLEDSTYWEDRSFLDEMKRTIGDGMADAIKQAATDNPNIGIYLDRVHEHGRELAQRPARPDLKSLEYLKLREVIMDDPKRMSKVWSWVWGMGASEQDLRLAADDLMMEDDPDRLLAYLRIFRKREFPGDPRRLFELSLSTDAKLSENARFALAQVRHPAVRGLIDKFIAEGELAVVRLMIRNFLPGDERTVASMLRDAKNDDVAHEICLATGDMSKANQDADMSQLLLEVYERSPCSICRRIAVEELQLRKSMPEWMPQECRYDCDAATRNAAATGSGRPE